MCLLYILISLKYQAKYQYVQNIQNPEHKRNNNTLMIWKNTVDINKINRKNKTIRKKQEEQMFTNATWKASKEMKLSPIKNIKFGKD